MSDDDLIMQVSDMLQKMNIMKKDQIVFSSVDRHRFAYVVYDLDYQKNIAVIQEYFRSTGIPLVGRFAQFEYLNMDGCIRSVMDFVSSRYREGDECAPVRL